MAKRKHMRHRIKRHRALTHVKLTISIYVNETHDGTGRTLELDIVGSLVISKKEYDNIKNVGAWCKQVVVRQLFQRDYSGLAFAVAKADMPELIKNSNIGYVFELTNEPLQSFVFDRVWINKKDYTNDVNNGISNIKRRGVK